VLDADGPGGDRGGSRRDTGAWPGEREGSAGRPNGLRRRSSTRTSSPPARRARHAVLLAPEDHRSPWLARCAVAAQEAKRIRGGRRPAAEFQRHAPVFDASLPPRCCLGSSHRRGREPSPAGHKHQQSSVPRVRLPPAAELRAIVEGQPAVQHWSGGRGREPPFLASHFRSDGYDGPRGRPHPPPPQTKGGCAAAFRPFPAFSSLVPRSGGVAASGAPRGRRRCGEPLSGRAPPPRRRANG
jgi:hypothetical protein